MGSLLHDFKSLWLCSGRDRHWLCVLIECRFGMCLAGWPDHPRRAVATGGPTRGVEGRSAPTVLFCSSIWPFLARADREETAVPSAFQLADFVQVLWGPGLKGPGL